MLDESLLTKNQTIAVALSGGKDSMCLLYLLLENKERLGIKVKAVNVEHGIRGASSLADSKFCVNLCKTLGVEIKTYSVDVPAYVQKHGVSEEAAARILRYECFDNALIGGFCDKIATAHHLSDSVETVLFNLFRGTSLKGVCGIDKTARGGIIRPILDASRKQIDDYIAERNIEYVTDESNFDTDYSRNFIRNKILPLVFEKFPFAEKNIGRFSDSVREEDELLDSLAEKYITGNLVRFPENGNALFIRASLIVMKRQGFTVDYTAAHLQAVCDLKNAQCGTAICLKNGLKAIRTKDGVIFEKPEEKTLDELPFSLGTHTLGKYEITFEKAARKDDGFLYFDLDKLPYSTVIRTKRDGDVIYAFGGKTKKLKKYLNDKKIESRVSAGFPLLASGNEVFAVCPIDIGEKIKIDNNTVNAVRIIITTRGDNNAQRS